MLMDIFNELIVFFLQIEIKLKEILTEGIFNDCHIFILKKPITQKKFSSEMRVEQHYILNGILR